MVIVVKEHKKLNNLITRKRKLHTPFRKLTRQKIVFLFVFAGKL
jgi:hypothetical protein